MFNRRTMMRMPLFLLMTLLSSGCLFQSAPAPRPEHTLEDLADAPPTAIAAPRPLDIVTLKTPVVATHAPGTVALDEVAPPPTGGKFIYDAKFEPPRGRILHGMGNFDDGNNAYLKMLNDRAIEPASKLIYAGIGDWPRSWDGRVQMFRADMDEEEKLGRIPHLTVQFYGIDPETKQVISVDHETATTDRYDSRIRDLAQVIAAHRGPVFIRIGCEFNGDWTGYHPYDYPAAYRKTVQIFREEGCDNCAFVWCYEPSAPADFDAKDARGYRWFPGDDVIDWYGIDLFQPGEFSGPSSSGSRGSLISKPERTQLFLKMAREHGKPVMIGECSPSTEEITSDLEDGRRDWANWFVPFLHEFDSHPEIEAFFLINTDWRKTHSADTSNWKIARLELNSYISQKWITEMRKSRYLHLRDVSLLNGYDAAAAPRPPYKGPVGVPTDPSEPRRGGAKSQR
jgi:hypothetical protein